MVVQSGWPTHRQPHQHWPWCLNFFYHRSAGDGCRNVNGIKVSFWNETILLKYVPFMVLSIVRYWKNPSKTWNWQWSVVRPCKLDGRVPNKLEELGEWSEIGKWHPCLAKMGNNDKNTQNLEKTIIILGSVKWWSAPNYKTRNTGFYVADVLPKLIGWFPAIPFMITNEIASNNYA